MEMGDNIPKWFVDVSWEQLGMTYCSLTESMAYSVCYAFSGPFCIQNASIFSLFIFFGISSNDDMKIGIIS